MEKNLYRIESRDLNPFKSNLFEWVDKVALRVKKQGEEDKKEFYENLEIKRELEKRASLMNLYNIITSPLSFAWEIIKKSKKSIEYLNK
jgi:hypothetical protein